MMIKSDGVTIKESSTHLENKPGGHCMFSNVMRDVQEDKLSFGCKIHNYYCIAKNCGVRADIEHR